MPFCPVCQAEYREGFTRCSGCDVDLVAQLDIGLDLSDDAIREALEGKDLVVVLRGQLDVVREVRNMLARRRIASVVLEDEEDIPQPGMPKRVILVVGQNDLQAAATALGESFRGLVEQEGLSVDEVPTHDRCPACGAAVSEELEECPECGLHVGKA